MQSSRGNGGGGGGGGGGEYTLAEVSQNNGENGSRVWIILWGNVYDVTDYMHQHPGGAELITEYAGMDATAGFDDFGHSSDAKKMLKKYEIGVLATNNNNNNNNNNNKSSSSHAPRKNRRKLLCAILGPCVST